MAKSVGVQVGLEGNALKLINKEQAKRAQDGVPVGKARLINILLSELYDRRIFDTLVKPRPMDNKTWKKFLKTE